MSDISQKTKDFFSQFTSQAYKKGEILIGAGVEPLGIYYLLYGQVKEFSISHKGDEVVVNMFKQGAFFPMSWAINGTENRYFFQAITDVQIYRAPREKVIAFLKLHPDVMYDLLSRILSGGEGLLRRISSLMSESAYSRIVLALGIHARRFGEGTTNIQLQVSETELAAETGLTRETVSRETRLLKEKGLASYEKGKFVIKDIILLEKELEYGV